MSVTLDAGTETPDAPPRKRWIWLFSLIAALILAVIGTDIGWLVYANTYQPLERGNFGGSLVGAAKALTDGVQDPSDLILTGPPLSLGGEMQSVENGGRHSVRLLGATEADADLKLTWLASGDMDTMRTLDQAWRASHPFPTVLKPDQQIDVFIMAIKPPTCRHEVGQETIDLAELRSESFGVHHLYDIDLTGRGFTDLVPISVCPRKAALQRTSK